MTRYQQDEPRNNCGVLGDEMNGVERLKSERMKEQQYKKEYVELLKVRLQNEMKSAQGKRLSKINIWKFIQKKGEG